MPSPIGHAIAGTAVAWTADIVDGRRSSGRLLTTCALLATTADLDLIWPPFHRQATHSALACRARLRHCLRHASAARLAGRRQVPASGHSAPLAFRPPVFHFRVGSFCADRTQGSARSRVNRSERAGGRAGTAHPRADRRRLMVSTQKSPGPTSARDVPPRPCGAVADTRGTWDRRIPRAAR